jgi:F-type H+-transporting ATPase subunit delta
LDPAVFPSSQQTKVENNVASEAAGVSGVAGRYALALYDLANQQAALDTAAQDLAQLRRMIEDNADLKRVLNNRILKRATKAAAIGAVVERAGLSELVGKFIGVLARNGRLAVLPQVIAAYTKILAEKRGEVTATVTASQELSEDQIAGLKDNLKRATGMNNVALDIWIDPAIIGGLVVKIGSRRIDGSLRTKLQKLQLAMKGI